MQATYYLKHHGKDLALTANTVFSDFEVKGVKFVKNWLKETGIEKLCASFEGTC
jgi:hypothetical protein